MAYLGQSHKTDGREASRNQKPDGLNRRKQREQRNKKGELV
jgi:hypothetical protein